MAEKKFFHMAIASFIFSLISIILIYAAYFSIFVGIYAIFKIKSHPELKGTGFAIAGIVISVLVFIFFS